MVKRKGQMTTFMILGVVLIIFSSIGFYLYKESTMSSFENKVDNIAQQMKITALDNYVESCLRGALMENIDSVALRGGFLGEIPLEFTSRGIISTAIAIDEHRDRDEYPDPPGYPNHNVVDGTGAVPEEFHIQPLSPYPFGKLSLRKLCQAGGPNDAPLHIFARPCPRGSYGPESIQQDLNVHVKIALEECVDPEYIKELSGYEIDVGDPIVSIIFGEEDVRAEAEFPIDIAFEEGNAVRTFEFSTEVPIRLKKVYGLAQHIINNDRFYVTYDKRDIESMEWRSEFYDSAMGVQVSCPKCPPLGADYTDVVTITDSRSDMDGKYLQFKFAIQNRIPVIEPIRGPSAAIDDGGEEIHFAIPHPSAEPAEIRIALFALDPDEDDLYVYYRGWMQDYITIRDSEVLLPTSDYRPPGSSDGFSPLLENPCRLETNFDERPTDCDRSITIHPSIFERRGDIWSEIFNPHEGLHTLTVIVCDKDIDPLHFPDDLEDDGEHKEHCDWQDIRIQIGAGRAALEREVGCYYEGVDTDDCISLEDPLILTTTGAPGTFTWMSPGGTLGRTSFERVPSRATLPDDVIEEYASDIIAAYPDLGAATPALTLDSIRRHRIKWIKWFLTTYVFTDTGSNTWTLDAGGMTETLPMDVNECVPYSNPANPPYPYNLPGDPFTADHACCNTGEVLGGTLKARGEVCYSGDTFGPPPIRGRDMDANPSALVDPHADAANDVWRRTVEHLCSGNQGNICDGVKSERRSSAALAACADFANPQQVERCEGPSVTTRPGTDILTYECKQYEPGESFENEFGLRKRASPTIDANGICADPPDYSTIGGDGMFDPSTNSGPFSCRGQCKTGTCSFAAECVCSNGGQPGAGARECNGVTYSALQASGGRGVANAATGAWCDMTCSVVNPDENQYACRNSLESSGRTWDTRSYSSGRPSGQRCCGDNPSEFLPSGPGNACCSAAGSCVIGSACVAPGSTSPDGRYFCDGGTSKLCTINEECAVSIDSSMWCNGERWESNPSTPLIGRVCGRGSLCARCQSVPSFGRIDCIGVSSNCPASAPVCRLIGLNFQCSVS